MAGKAKAQIKGIQAGKHLQLSKAQKSTLVVAGVAIFALVFTAFAAVELIGRWQFQGKVIDAKQLALDQLKSNQKAVASLNSSYQSFVATTENAIGGNPDGNGPQDGSNAKLVLDALPSKYDFPALTSSLEKIITGQNMQIEGISGTDDQANQQDNTSSASPQPVDIPFSVSAGGSYKQAQSLIDQFERSIRPFQIETLDLSGDQDNMTISLGAHTYYQPGIKFQIKHKEVK